MFLRRFAVAIFGLIVVVETSTKNMCVTRSQCHKRIDDTRFAFVNYTVHIDMSEIQTKQNFTRTVKFLYDELRSLIDDKSDCLHLLPSISTEQLSMELQKLCQPRDTKIPSKEKPKGLEDFPEGYQGTGGSSADRYFCSIVVPYLNRICSYLEDRLEAIRLCDVKILFDKFYRQPVLKCVNS